MARNAAKGKGKAATTTTTTMPSKLKTATPPAPYTFPSEALKSFLALRDPKYIYITHLDDHPRDFKMRIFAVPAIMNILIAGGLIVRARYIAPYYASLLMTMWGLSKEYYVDVHAAGWNLLVDETVRRALTLLMDVFLFTILGQWPYDFLLAMPASAVRWRRTVGFKDVEIAVRRSRRWQEQLKTEWLREEDPEGKVYKERIMPAIERNWIKLKTAYMMMDKSWDLDFGAMIQAHKLVDIDEMKIEDFRKQVLVYDHAGGLGWLVWPVWKLDESTPKEEAGRSKILKMRERLKEMDKEDLFFRWIELVQFESSQPGGFTKKRQENAMMEARKLFGSEGVDFEQFWKDIGGEEGMPGMGKGETD